VTGLDADGQSVIALDDNPAVRSVGEGNDARVIVDVWSTQSASAPDSSAQAVGGSALGPNGTEIRIVELPPGCRREMHRTETIDYGLVLSGELTMVMERGETVLRSGDIVVQRGTNHAWLNRSDVPTRIAFINMSGQTTNRKRCPDV
jgi:uncharacterized cupin superfamily protein